MIGDGMGPAQLHAAFPKGDSVFAKFPVRSTLTHCSLSGLTDSAASATAMATGEKTYNGMLAYSPNKRKLKTILEIAQSDFNKATGLVTTTEITHATPAAFASHVRDRQEGKIVAKQYLKNTKPTLLLGGGEKYFLPLGLPSNPAPVLWKNFQVFRSFQDLQMAKGDFKGNLRILGLFNREHLSWDLERTQQPEDNREPSLQALTSFALDFLSKNPNGFFLMIEGGRIDHAGHANNLENLIAEVKAFNRVGETVLAFAQTHADTLVIVTADHETGGLHPVGKGYGFSTHFHTDTPVPIFGFGPNADAIPLTPSDNRIVFHLLHQALLP